jgi:hypothetical protein
MHAYSQWLMIFTQTLTGCTSYRSVLILHVLTSILLHKVLCVVRVYAMYGKNRRILGFLAFTAVISVVTGAVCLFPRDSKDAYTCSTVFFF